MEEHPQKQPERHSELHDPKLPIIHGGNTGNRAEQQRRPAPIPEQQIF